MAVAALVLGILAALTLILFFISTSVSATAVVIAIPLALTALALGLVARRGALKRTGPTAVATAGLVLGIIATLVTLVLLVFFAKAIESAKDFSSDPATRERLQKERIKNNKEFDEVFNKAIESDTATAPKKK